MALPAPGRWCGPAAAGTTTWPPAALATPTLLALRMWTGGVAAGTWSPRQAATTPATPTSSWLAGTWTPRSPRCRRRCGSGWCPVRSTGRLCPSSLCRSLAVSRTPMRGRRWPRNWRASPRRRLGSATAGCGRPAATSTTSSPAARWRSARSTRACWRRPTAAGCSGRSPARPTAPWPLPARSAWPIRARPLNAPAPNATMPRRRRPPGGAAASRPGKGGDRDGRCRPPGRLILSEGGRVPPPSRARAHPTTPQGKEPRMGSPPTLAHRLDHQEATAPAARAAEAADAASRQANPDRAHMANHSDPMVRRQLVRAMEDVEVRGYRVWTQEARENWPTLPEERQAVLRQRAAAQLTTEQAERAFDRLNPEFGLPADHTDPLGQRAVRDR